MFSLTIESHHSLKRYLVSRIECILMPGIYQRVHFMTGQRVIEHCIAFMLAFFLPGQTINVELL